MNEELQRSLASVTAEVWQSTLNYVVVDAVGGLLFALGCAAAAAWVARRDWDAEVRVVAVALAVVLALLVGYHSIMTLLYPATFAAKALLP